jgi:hypothetical protein
MVPFINRMLDCAFCTGVWAAGLLCFTLPPGTSWRESVTFVLAGAGAAYVLDSVVAALETYVEK